MVSAENSVFSFWITAFFAGLIETALLFFGALIRYNQSAPNVSKSDTNCLCPIFSLEGFRTAESEYSE